MQQMKREEAKREAEEKARHSAMLEGLRQEAERRLLNQSQILAIRVYVYNFSIHSGICK